MSYGSGHCLFLKSHNFVSKHTNSFYLMKNLPKNLVQICRSHKTFYSKKNIRTLDTNLHKDGSKEDRHRGVS